MYLKAIKANGFKSFAIKTHISLEKDITCIVGPNGSGKSNIVDAVRWVLGEQSVKSLRGTNAMTDVIFAGSKSRSAANRAEVSLIFDNSDHYLDCELTEIEVKRVLYRNGEGEYFINNTPVRLKDITNLFLDSGAGIDSFNIISQGSIESVINSKPYERRSIFEEAAGVLKYKRRKEESIRKLEKTKENMEKVSLIITELESNLNPLKEQSENAQKYLELKDQLKQLEIATITQDITNIHDKYEKIKIAKEEGDEQLVALETIESQEASKLENLKLKNLKLESAINEKNAQLLDVTSRYANLQNEKLMYTERQKYKQEGEQVDSNIVKLKEEILAIDKDIALLENDLEQINSQSKKIKLNLQDVNEEQSLLKTKQNALNIKYQNNLREMYTLKSQEEILENSILNDNKLPVSVKSILNNDRLKQVYGPIGKLITVPSSYAIAIDVALGASTNFLVVADENVAKESINYLKENQLGRVTFLPLNIIKAKEIPASILKRLEQMNGYIGIASDLVEYDGKFTNIIKNQLGNIIVVDTIDTLNRIGRILEYKYRIVSLEGEIIHTGGSLTGGSLKSSSSIIKDKLELEQTKNNRLHCEELNTRLQKELDDYHKNQDILKEQEDTLNRNLFQLEEQLTEKNSSLETKKQKQLELNKELEGITALKSGNVDQKLMNLLTMVNETLKEKKVLETNLNQMKTEKSELQSEIAELEHNYRDKNSTYNKMQSDLKNKEVELGKLDIQLDNLLQVLNETYNITYEKAKLDYVLEIDSLEARNTVRDLKSKIANLGEVNVFAITEYEQLNTRYNFLVNQKNDLEQASLNLTNVIAEMDTIMIDKFKTTFNKINAEFQLVFKKLFKGGTGMLKLTDPEDVLNTGIEIIAEPPGKKLNSIGLLSGGEKTLTAISLLFAVLNVKTVPFCILDEVEASLDEANVDAFGKYLQEQKANSQFILITHKKRTMEYADTLYGITMQESGVSKLVSVHLDNLS